MTDTTPFEELMESVLNRNYAVRIVPPADRAATVKALWAALVERAPPGGLGGPDGLIVAATDPWGGEQPVSFEKITYGRTVVIEAEGVVVCRMI